MMEEHISMKAYLTTIFKPVDEPLQLNSYSWRLHLRCECCSDVEEYIFSTEESAVGEAFYVCKACRILVQHLKESYTNWKLK